MIILKSIGERSGNNDASIPENVPIIVARGPSMNRVIVYGLPWWTTQELAKKLLIGIEKTRHRIELVHHKLGDKFIPGEVELQIGEFGTDIQPADSEIIFQQAGKSKVYSYRKPLWSSSIGAAILAEVIGVIFFVIMLSQFFTRDENQFLFFVWAIPMVTAIAAGLWIYAIGSEQATFMTLPDELTVKHGFLFRRKTQILPVKNILSIQMVYIGISQTKGSAYEIPIYELSIRSLHDEDIQLLRGQLSPRDYRWLVHQLNEDLGIASVNRNSL